MKKLVFTIVNLTFFVSICFSQDLIIKKMGEDIEAKVLEVGLTEIKYKKFNNPNGPMYTMLKSEIIVIKYENGTKDIFDKNEVPYVAPAIKLSITDVSIQGQKDADLYYRHYVGAGTGTLVVGLLSPLVGLIPAIACSSTPPSDRNLDYPSPTLMNDINYRRGYAARARKIKQGKVWTNWGIAFGINIIAYVVLSSQ